MSQPLLRRRSDSLQLTGTSSHHQPTGNQSEKNSLRSSKEDIEKSSFCPQFGGLERRDSKCTDAHAHHTRQDQRPASGPEENSQRVENSFSPADLSSSQRASPSDLPEFQTSSSPAFTWASSNGEDFTRSVKQAYLEVVHWIPNVFAVPLGAVGKRFVEETTRLIRGFADETALEGVSLWALMLMPSLLLQQPAATSTHRQRVDCLQRRLGAWAEGRLQDLLSEGRVLQADLKRRTARRQLKFNGRKQGGL